MKKLVALIVAVLVLKWWFTDPSIEVTLDNPNTPKVSMEYLVKYSSAANSNKLLPLLVVLHGNGDTAENFYNTALDLVKIPVRTILIKAPIPYCRGRSWPTDAAGFKLYGEAVNAAVENFSVKFSTAGKPLLLGFSGGAMMAYYQALKYGDSYSVIIPVSGMMTKNLLGEGKINPAEKVIAYHGNNDNVVSISGAKTAIALLKEHNINVEFTTFDGGHLGIFTNIKPEISLKLEQLLAEF